VNKTRVSLLYTTVKAHWGYIVRQPGATAAQTAYILPPPPTVVGAFAAVLGRLLGIPDAHTGRRKKHVLTGLMECALQATIAAGAGLLAAGEGGAGGGVALVEEPSRIIGAPYKGGGALNRALSRPIALSAGDLLPVQAVGAASGPGTLLVLAWLLDTGRLESCLGRRIGNELLSVAPSSVFRLGSREGLVSVVGEQGRLPGYGAVSGEKLEVLGSGHEYESILYQPASCTLPESRASVASVVLLDEHYREREYLAPASPGSGPGVIYPPSSPARFRVAHGSCLAYAPRGGLRALALAVPGAGVVSE